MSNRQTGATLPEVLVTFAILGALAAVGLPALASFGASVRTSDYANQLIASLWHARSEAILQNNRVKLCKSADGEHCTTAGNWTQGWIVFRDTNQDGVRDADESVIKAQNALDAAWAVSGNATVRDHVIYDANGESIQQSGAFLAGTFTVCQMTPDSTTAIQIVINKVGRPRSQKVDIDHCS